MINIKQYLNNYNGHFDSTYTSTSSNGNILSKAKSVARLLEMKMFTALIINP